MADWVATVALGVLLNNLGEVTKDMGRRRALNADTELAAFWAPFLLLVLTIYNQMKRYKEKMEKTCVVRKILHSLQKKFHYMEDNDLWLTHFLGLVVQTGVAVYIFFMAWRGSYLSILTLPKFLAGIIKYGERTWALRSASNEKLRDSMLTPDAGPNYSKFMEELTLKRSKVDVSNTGGSSVRDTTELIQAHYLFTTFERLFVNLILSFQDRDNSQNLFKDMSSENAFKVIEIELGFIFYVLYTEGTITFSRVGSYLRFINLSSTFVVLVFCSFAHEKNHWKKIDLAITFLSLAVAIFLELYAIILLHPKIRKAIAPFQRRKHLRWSNSLAQHSLLSFCLKSMSKVSIKIQKLFGIDKVLEELQHRSMKEFSDDLKKLILNHMEKFQHMSESTRYESELKALCTCRGDRVLKSLEFSHDLIWSVEPKKINCKISRQLSHYTMYLLVMRPFIKGTSKLDEKKACDVLLNVNTVVPPVKVKGDRSKPVLFDACRLASQLRKLSDDKGEKWKLISNVWVEMMAYAASCCSCLSFTLCFPVGT
ncbi:hypothetical protein BDE02_14G023700 [Populus trichocarpa]|nr:hypothetical protein BDE02_14G023700 [Populus trichocarpa]